MHDASRSPRRSVVRWRISGQYGNSQAKRLGHAPFCSCCGGGKPGFSLFVQDQSMGVCTRAHPCLPRFSSTLPSLIITCQGAKRTETTTKCLTSVSNLTLPSPLGYDTLHLGVYVCWFPGSAGICLCPASAPHAT